MSLQVISRFAPAVVPKTPTAVFLREGNLMYAEGEAIVLRSSGEDRIQELSAKWQELVAETLIQDEVRLWGSGLVGFTSISFSAQSGFESVVIVPAKLTVIRDGYSFVTEVLPPGPTVQNTTPSGKFAPGSMTESGFLAQTKNAIELIQTTDLEKVVLARDLVMPLESEPDLSAALEKLHARYPHCWTYLVADNFGASPELLLRSEAAEVSARVLAGTAARGTDPDVDRAIAEGLAHSSKNKHEHEYAVRSLMQSLADFCENLEADSEPFSLALPDLWHLATDVRGKLKQGVTLLDAVSALHPTAAVAGTPTKLAQKTIAELEPFDRGGYAGPIGWIAADGSGELAIALRGGRVEREPLQIRAFAGCGIVAESEPTAELEETELKFRAVRYALETNPS